MCFHGDSRACVPTALPHPLISRRLSTERRERGSDSRCDVHGRSLTRPSCCLSFAEKTAWHFTVCKHFHLGCVI